MAKNGRRKLKHETRCPGAQGETTAEKKKNKKKTRRQIRREKRENSISQHWCQPSHFLRWSSRGNSSAKLSEGDERSSKESPEWRCNLDRGPRRGNWKKLECLSKGMEGAYIRWKKATEVCPGVMEGPLEKPC